MEAWVQIISSVGFPIAACVALFYFMITLLKEHKEEINALRQVLQDNTLALIKLQEAIEHGGSRDIS